MNFHIEEAYSALLHSCCCCCCCIVGIVYDMMERGKHSRHSRQTWSRRLCATNRLRAWSPWCTRPLRVARTGSREEWSSRSRSRLRPDLPTVRSRSAMCACWLPSYSFFCSVDLQHTTTLLYSLSSFSSSSAAAAQCCCCWCCWSCCSSQPLLYGGTDGNGK